MDKFLSEGPKVKIDQKWNNDHLKIKNDHLKIKNDHLKKKIKNDHLKLMKLLQRKIGNHSQLGPN